MSDNLFIRTTNHVHANYRYCPKCNERLKAVTIENNGNAKKGSKYLDSDKMKSYRTEFHCQKCRLKYTLEDLRKIENKNRKSEM